MQIVPNVQNEFNRLKTVVVGIARRMGGTPRLEECYDARSYESVEINDYPSEEDCMAQMKGLIDVLEKLGTEVLRPEVLDGVNQVFARDIAFVIEDQFILPNVIEDRAQELHAVDSIVNSIPSSNIIMMPSGCYAEGGDVIVHKHQVFVGVSDDETFQKFKTARTNMEGFEYLMDEFPGLEFKGFQLNKDDINPRKGCLHLDCAFQPLGTGAVLAPECFKHQSDVEYLVELFGSENIYYCQPEEAYNLSTNVFSVGPDDVIVAEHQTGLANWLETRGVNVHLVKYDEIVKMGGLLRCSTMPLIRE